MIPPAAGEVMFRFSAFIVVMAALVLVWGRPAPDTPAFVITVLMLAIGVAFGTALFVAARLSARRLGKATTDKNPSMGRKNHK